MARLLRLIGLFTAVVAGAQEAPLGIPLKADPPFAIDGDLADWAGVPGEYRLAQAAQVVHGPGAWSGEDDLSATVRLAWRSDGLYLAAEVTDDQHRQTQRGDTIWRGDHLELYLDTQPDLEPQRREYGVGQYQLLVSPGNFQATGDALADCRPEAQFARPREASAAEVRVAARRAAAGYHLEVLIPWAAIGVTAPAAGLAFRFEVGVSDTDGPEPKQECLLALSPAPWALTRARMVHEACLAGTDGVARPQARRLPIFGDLTVAAGQAATVTFTAPPVPAGREAMLAFSARLATPQVAGHTPALRVLLNGQAVPGANALRRPQRVASRGGNLYSMYAGDIFTIYYSPDFKSPDSHPTYGLLDEVKACSFELRVTDLLREGANELRLLHAQPKTTHELVLGDGRLEFQVPPPAPRPKAGPPTGPLPTIEPATTRRTPYTLQDPGDGRLAVTVSGRTFTVSSRFSTPQPAWVSGGNPHFGYQRRVEQRDEAIVVRETFTNRGDANLGVMQRHEVTAAGGIEQFWVGGLLRPSGRSTIQEPHNPTVFATSGPAGLGLVPLSDVLRCHATSYADGTLVGLADNECVLRPGASLTAEWAIVPAAAPDYWTFLNATRRLVDANFPIDGGFCFLRADPKLTEPWSDEQTANFLRFKDVKYACATIPSIGGIATQGTLFQTLDLTRYKTAFERRRRLVPGIQNLVYFHCFIDASPDSAERFADSRLLRPDGQQADYGQPRYKLFVPLADNRYGPAIARNIDLILDDIKAEGVYWDEHEYSAYHYHYGPPWDGVSGDIDRTTMRVTRTKSDVTLLTESWRLAQAKRILARAPLIGNGSPVTAAMAALKFPCFVETGSITNCTRNHLYSPIALGDHLTERSEADAYRTMVAALDYGSLYHWYNDVNVMPTHPTLTRYMYPFTPVELHAGYVLGTDRIVTNRSGLYGFGDASRLEAHVFNDQGVEVADFDAPTVTRDGKTWIELRIGEDWSAAILKRP